MSWILVVDFKLPLLAQIPCVKLFWNYYVLRKKKNDKSNFREHPKKSSISKKSFEKDPFVGLNVALPSQISFKIHIVWRLSVLHKRSSDIPLFHSALYTQHFQSIIFLDLICWFWFGTVNPKSIIMIIYSRNSKCSTEEANFLKLFLYFKQSTP